MNSRSGLLVALLLAVAAAAACNGDDDAQPTLPTDPPTTVPASTVPASSATDPPTTPPTTAAATTVAPSTTVDIEALKAEIAADYVESYQARAEFTSNPSLDDLPSRASAVAATGSVAHAGFVQLVTDLVETNERVVPGDPPYDEVTVELVELSGLNADAASITACRVFNAARVGADGVPTGETGVLRAARTQQQVQRTALGWLPASEVTVTVAVSGATSCPAP